MEVVGSGVIWDARSAPVNERSASATSAIRLSDGTVLATCRLGTDREGPDGHTGVFASTDRGETWELRYLSLPEREWDGWPGETRGWYIAELTPGVLTASVLWTDRTDPADPWVHPVTQGLLGMRVYQLISTDGGRTLARTPADRPVAAPGGIVDRPGHRARRRRPGPALRALEGAARSGSRVGRRRGSACRPTAARPGRPTCSSPTIPTTRSTTGTSGSRSIPTTAVSSTCSGPATWRRPWTSTSTSRGDRRTVATGRCRSGPGCRASTASPSRSGAIGCWPSTRTVATRRGSAPR